MLRIGFIGLGSQGAPMARRIIDAGYPTSLWARRRASLESFDDTKAQIAETPAALAAASDLVCLCVVGDGDIQEVTDGPTGVLAGLQAGSILAVHSTVHPETCRQLAEAAAGHGCSVLDAPVSGGGLAAAEGRLLVMVGGDADAVDRCRPVFNTYAGSVVHVGSAGLGQIAKLLNNLLMTANLGTAAGTLTLGSAFGIAPDRLAEVISQGSGTSFALNSMRRFGGSLDGLSEHAGALLQKDVRLLVDLAEPAHVNPSTVVAAAADALRRMNYPI